MSQANGTVVPDWTVGWRMQRALTHAGLHVEEMADELGVSRSTVSRWVNDKGPVRPIYLKQWALRCGVPFEWLQTGAVGPAGQGSHGSTGGYRPDNTELLPAAA